MYNDFENLKTYGHTLLKLLKTSSHKEELYRNLKSISKLMIVCEENYIHFEQ